MPTTQLSVKEIGGVSQKTDGLQEVVGHHRVEDVEFEVALAAREGDGRVVAHDVGADLRQRFALGGVHLARHDRRARLVFRQGEFAETGAGARPEEADVVGDLEAGGGDRGDRAVAHHHRVVRGQRLELVRRGLEGEAGDLGDLGGDQLVEAFRRVEAGADGGAALRQFHQGRAAST